MSYNQTKIIRKQRLYIFPIIISNLTVMNNNYSQLNMTAPLNFCNIPQFANTSQNPHPVESLQRQDLGKSVDKQRWRYDQILQHNQQLLKQNEILAKRLAQVSKGTSGLYSCIKQSDKSSSRRQSSQLMKVLAQVKKQKDQLLIKNNSLQQKLRQLESKSFSLNFNQSKKQSISLNNGLEQIQLLQQRITEIQKNNNVSEIQIQRLKEQLIKTEKERDQILQNYEKQKQISQSVIQSLKTDIESNREKQKKVVQIVRVLQKEKDLMESELRAFSTGRQQFCVRNSFSFNKGAEKQLQKRIQVLQKQNQKEQEIIQDLNSTIIKKDNYIAKTLNEHKSRLTKALQSYIQRIGISKKLKPAELLRERSSVLSQWDLNLDNPIEYQ